MDLTLDIQQFAKNPDIFLELIQNVIKVLESEDDKSEKVAMAAQLREISRAIEKLEKNNFSVPDAFRAEKTRLAAALENQSESIQLLNFLLDGLYVILEEMNTKMGRTSDKIRKNKGRKIRSFSPKTEDEVLREHIILALRQLGGSANLHDVLKYMEEALNGKLLPGDFEWRESTNDYAWQNNACWERFRMTQEGILKKDSQRGIWELSEGYK